jgi:prepilin-type N-terminal cleavage/methylation domain-containing protein
MRRRRTRRAGRSGFTLIELTISLAVLLVALALASQLLMETAQLFAETSGESLDAPVPLVLARIRADVQGSVGAYPVLDGHGALEKVVIQDLGRQIVYGRAGGDLYRTLVLDDGSPPRTALLWRGITGWSCRVIDPKGLIELAVSYRRRSVPSTPLPVLPAFRGPVTEELTQRMFLLPRGAGLGDTW